MGNSNYDLIGIRNYYYSASGGLRGWYDLNSYVGSHYYTSSSAPFSLVWPSSIGLFSFIGTSPVDEWSDAGDGGK